MNRTWKIEGLQTGEKKVKNILERGNKIMEATGGIKSPRDGCSSTPCMHAHACAHTCTCYEELSIFNSDELIKVITHYRFPQVGLLVMLESASQYAALLNTRKSGKTSFQFLYLDVSTSSNNIYILRNSPNIERCFSG